MKNWKTTLIACLLAVGIAVEPMISEGNIDWKKIGIAAFVALLGFFMKDANVTGGTTPATEEATARLEEKK